MKTDILVFGAHPDDAELSCGGTILHHISLGKKVGIIDLSRGEMGTRGTPKIRSEEAALAAEILGIQVRENIGLPDGNILNDKRSRLEIIKMLRKYKPEIVLAPARKDRHPDHEHGAILVEDACFLSGIAKIDTFLDGKQQPAWRPKAIYNYIQSTYINPTFVVDISPYMERKIEVIKAYQSQFFDPKSEYPPTFISSKGFLDLIYARAKHFGYPVGVEYGEGYTSDDKMLVRNLFDLL